MPSIGFKIVSDIGSGLPPVPLTARERHWQSSDPGASGSSVSSARRSLPERDGRSSSQHARTVTGAPSKDPKSCATVVQVVVPAGNRPGRWQEPGSNSEPSRKLAQTTKPPSRETASPVFAGYASAPSPESRESREGEGEGGVAWEMPSCPSPAGPFAALFAPLAAFTCRPHCWNRTREVSASALCKAMQGQNTCKILIAFMLVPI